MNSQCKETIKNNFPLPKGKAEQCTMFVGVWEDTKEQGNLTRINSRGQTLTESGYRIWNNDTSYILSWRLPASKPALLNMLTLNKWQDYEIEYDEKDLGGSFDSTGCRYFLDNGREIEEVIDFEGEDGLEVINWGSIEKPWEIHLAYKDDKELIMAENVLNDLYHCGFPGGEVRELSFAEVVRLIAAL